MVKSPPAPNKLNIPKTVTIGLAMIIPTIETPNPSTKPGISPPNRYPLNANGSLQ